MKSFNDYDKAKKEAQASAMTKLPAGAYVCKIKDVRYETTDYGDRIVLAFDIARENTKISSRSSSRPTLPKTRSGRARPISSFRRMTAPRRTLIPRSRSQAGRTLSRSQTPVTSGTGTRTSGRTSSLASCSARQAQTLTARTLSTPKRGLRLPPMLFVPVKHLLQSSKLVTVTTEPLLQVSLRMTSS